MKHFIEGNTYAVKDKLKELGCRYDMDSKRWHHTDNDIAEQAQALVPARAEKTMPEKFFITGDCSPVAARLKELGCRFDGESKRWHHADKDIAQQAQAIVSGSRIEKHYIESVPFDLNKQMKELGCRWDTERKCWYHTDPEIAQQAERLVQEHGQQSPEHKAGMGNAYAAHSIVKEMEQGM